MTNSKIYYILMLSLVIISCASSTKQELFKEGVSDWSTDGDASWTFENGVITGVADSTTGFLQTHKAYKDFVLNLEFKPDSTINSGVFVRCNSNAISATDCYEINIWDLHPNQDYRTGAIVARQKPMAMVMTLNKWNTYTIECKNNTIRAWVNNTLTAEFINNELSSGSIALQAAGNGTIEFKNVVIESLE